MTQAAFIPSSIAAPARSAARLPLRMVLGWGAGCAVAATVYQVTSVLLLRYLVDEVGMAAALAGGLIGFSKIYDMVADPFIGTVSDRTRSPWGRRRPFLLAGGLVSALSFAGLFSISGMHDAGLRLPAVVAALLCVTTGYALFSVPHLAMPGEMTTDYHERTFVMSFRVAGQGIATLAGTVLGPWLIVRYGGGAQGYATMGAAVGAILMAGALVCFWATRGAPATEPSAAPALSALQKLKLALGNRPFASLMGCKLGNMIGVTAYSAILPFLFVTVTKAGYGRLSVYFLFTGLATLVSQPIWVAISRLLGKRRTFALAAALYGLGAATWGLAAAGEPVGYTIARALWIGLAGGGTLGMASALLPDAIAHDFDRTGLRREGVFAGAVTTVEKSAGAIAASLIGAGLSLAGYASGAAASHQPAGAILVIRLATLAPLLFCMLGAAALLAYDLPDRRD
jgi:GPH family glycoside/pentoside/hexuronide:cation symporter